MSLPKDVSVRIDRALKGLKVANVNAREKVISTVDNAHQVLRDQIVPMSREFRDLSGLSARGKRRDIMGQMKKVIDTNIGLRTYPELAPDMDGDAPLALLIWGSSLTSTSGQEVLPAKLQLGVLGETSKAYGFDTIDGWTVDLAEITGKGDLVPFKGSAKPRISHIYDSSPVIKLIK